MHNFTNKQPQRTNWVMSTQLIEYHCQVHKQDLRIARPSQAARIQFIKSSSFFNAPSAIARAYFIFNHRNSLHCILFSHLSVTKVLH